MTGESESAASADDGDRRRAATVAIVGGGITGLALAHYLDQRDVEFVLFEAAADPGGVMRSEWVDGTLLERGPQRIRRTDHVDGLISDLGLEGSVRTADPDLPVCVYADGDLQEAPFSPSAFAETELLSWRGKLDVLREPYTDPADPGETAEELFVRKFGREAYERLLGPLFGGIYGSDPAAMPVEHALSALPKLEARDGSLLKTALKRTTGGRDTPPAISFDEGLQQLPRALAEAHADSVRLGEPVVGVEKVESGYSLTTVDDATTVEQVVLTTPADLTADLVSDLAPDAASALRELNYNSLAMVALRADDGPEREALGYQVGFGEDLRTLGASWNESMFGRDAYTVFLGGMHDPEVLEESDATLGDIAATEFEAATGASAAVIDVWRLRRGFPAYDESWDAVERISVPEGVRLATNYTARMGVPSRIREAESVAEEIAAGGDGGDGPGED